MWRIWSKILNMRLRGNIHASYNKRFTNSRPIKNVMSFSVFKHVKLSTIVLKSSVLKSYGNGLIVKTKVNNLLVHVPYRIKESYYGKRVIT